MPVQKPSTLANWQKKHEWLLIKESTMYCRLCMKYENNISSVKGFTKKFIDGSATSLKYIKRGKETYQRWYKKFSASPEKVFELHNMKSVL